MRTLDDVQWDFAPAINLIHSFSDVCQNDESVSYCQHSSVDNETTYSDVDEKSDLTATLGDFDSIWKFLGLPLTSQGEDEVAKTVRWRDEVDGADLADDDDNADDDRFAGLTKKQRKKARCRARAKELTERLANEALAKLGKSEIESGEDNGDDLLVGSTKKERNKVRREARLEAFKASLRSKTASAINASSRQPEDVGSGLRPEDVSNSPTEEASRKNRHEAMLHAFTNGQRNLSLIDATFDSQNGNGDSVSSLPKHQHEAARQGVQKDPNVHLLRNGKMFRMEANDYVIQQASSAPLLDRRSIIHEWMQRPIPPANSLDAPSKAFQPLGLANNLISPTYFTDAPNQLSSPWKTSNGTDPPLSQLQGIHYGPAGDVYSIATARKAKLMHMLTENFHSERPYLSNISIFHHDEVLVADASAGVHIFIDASNIMIGFHDALKMLWKMPKSARIRRQTLSFHSLSLILCRGRPTAKRVVVGSDNSSEMSEAKFLGYETNILDRVRKAKDITPHRKGHNSGNGTHSAGSGSETAAKAPEKWAEQAVDEILHLKMMESIVDAREPATMVLATGDAAEAEYSGGFLKMIERALGKGWNVELVCWRQNMSSAYRRHEFRKVWGDRFKVVELDAFVELLYGA